MAHESGICESVFYRHFFSNLFYCFWGIFFSTLPTFLFLYLYLIIQFSNWKIFTLTRWKCEQSSRESFQCDARCSMLDENAFKLYIVIVIWAEILDLYTQLFALVKECPLFRPPLLVVAKKVCNLCPKTILKSLKIIESHSKLFKTSENWWKWWPVYEEPLGSQITCYWSKRLLHNHYTCCLILRLSPLLTSPSTIILLYFTCYLINFYCTTIFIVNLSIINECTWLL